jgi:flagellar hook assembly protein FlgD
VVYTPTAEETYDAEITIADNTTGHTVKLTGKGKVSDSDVVAIEKTELKGNYPNPFNPETTIRFNVGNSPLNPHSENGVVIDIYNVKGAKVRSLVNGVYSSGSHSVVWNGLDDNGVGVSSGVYFYRLKAGEYTEVKKMMLMK